MERLQTTLAEVCLLQPRVFSDLRGFFLETYHRDHFASLGITDQFVQDNHSRSVKGILRGLHYQLRFPQAKLCRVIRGEVLDVVVDIRKGSSTFGEWTSATLSEENKLAIYIPAGFAHGFLVLSETADFLYKCSDFYHPEDEHGIAWNDPELAIQWGVVEPILSKKDSEYRRLAEISPEKLPPYVAARLQ